MPFSEEADLNLSEARLIELTDSEDDPGVKDDDLIERMQSRATAKVKAALFGKYVVDDTGDFPPILTQIEADLWRFYLYAHREVMEVPKLVAEDYKASMDLLERYRTGKEALDAARRSAATEPTTTEGAFSADSDNRVFGREKDGF
jgi:phage gp36-like protein